MVFYLDLIWLMNFIFDSLLVLWTTIILKRSIKLWRVFLGGLVGSLPIFLYVTDYKYLLNFLGVKILISLLMVITGVPMKSWRQLLSGLLTFYFVTFLAGGLLYGMHSLIVEDVTEFSDGIGVTGDQVSWIFLLLGFPITFLLLKNRTNSFRRVNFFHKQVIKARCKINNVVLNIEGLVDTGNQLADPLTNMPIVILSVPKKRIDLPENIFGDDIQNLNEMDLSQEWMMRMHIIPYKVIGSKQNLMLAFRPDYFEIDKKNKKCLISFTRQRLSEAKDYDAIIHPDLVS